VSSKKTPRIKLFSITPKILKEVNNGTNEESDIQDVHRSPTFGMIFCWKNLASNIFAAELGLSSENLSTPSKIQPPTPKLSTWTAVSSAKC